MHGLSCPLASASTKHREQSLPTLSGSSLRCQQLLQTWPLSWTSMDVTPVPARLQPPAREHAHTFHSDFFDLFGFLINPLLPPDFLSCAHQFLQFLNLLFERKWESFRDKLGEKTPVSLGAWLLRRKLQAGADGLSCAQTTRTAPARHVLPVQRSSRTLSQCLLLSLTGWGCCCPTDLAHRGEEQNPWESIRWLRHESTYGEERGGELGLLTVLACRAVRLSADAGSCMNMLPSPAFPLPGTEDPPAGGQTDRQAHLPTPWYHHRPSFCSTPKLFKDSKAAQPRHSRRSRFLCLHLPPEPSSPAKRLEKHPGPAAHGALPQHSCRQKPVEALNHVLLCRGFW